MILVRFHLGNIQPFCVVHFAEFLFWRSTADHKQCVQNFKEEIHCDTAT